MKRFLKKYFSASHVRNARAIKFAMGAAVTGVVLLPFAWEWALGCFLAFQFYWICGLTAGWHRYFCHGAFKTRRIWEELMLFAGCASLSGHPGAFSAVHLQHHRYSDTEQDPHTHYKDVVFAATKLAGIKMTPAMKKRFFLSPQMKRVHQLYMLYPVVTALALACISIEAFVWLWAVPVAVMQLVRKYLLVIIPHNPKVGYQTYDVGDKSRNVWSLGVLFGGEGYHNNHHKRPGHWNFAHQWWEFDPTSLFVRMIKQ